MFSFFACLMAHAQDNPTYSGSRSVGDSIIVMDATGHVYRIPATMDNDSQEWQDSDYASENMQPQSGKKRHIQRIDREVMKSVFVPKGTWMFGGNVSYSEYDGDNINMLVLNNVDGKGYTFSASPYFGYFIKNNLAIGGRFTYNRQYINLGNLDLNLGEDFNINLDHLYYLAHKYDGAAFLRSYMPLGRSKIFAFFAETRLGYAYSQGKNSTGTGTTYDGTYEVEHNLQLGFCPGLTAFATDFMACEVSMNVMGVNYKWTKQVSNQVETGTRHSGGANFKINLFSINIGMTIYL